MHTSTMLLLWQFGQHGFSFITSDFSAGRSRKLCLISAIAFTRTALAKKP
ncbi:hypothetical protein L1D22_19195 [Vibrio sp. Isolate34]|nr:hypothetical protein [Vibrio sp. Isolate34]MCG9641980.1 hypothetical protein [Vibrio sp. Isolate34]